MSGLGIIKNSVDGQNNKGIFDMFIDNFKIKGFWNSIEQVNNLISNPNEYRETKR